MKKIFGILILGCGYLFGFCADPIVVNMQAQQKEQSFKKKEKELAQKIDEIANFIKDEINQTETTNQKELESLRALEKEIATTLLKNTFLLKKINYLQSNINNIQSE